MTRKNSTILATQPGLKLSSRFSTITFFLLAAMLAPVVVSAGAEAASSPGGASAAPWPAAWNEYRFNDGTSVRDVNTDENPNNFDLASGTCVGSCIGPNSTVQYASDGTTAFFRIRMATNIGDSTRGGLVGGAFLTQIAVDGVVRAVVGVDGKSPSVDYVYVADSVGGVVNSIYEHPFDSSGGQLSAGMRVVPIVGGGTQSFLDFQVPLSTITAISGNTITASTGIQLFYGSSAAANLATINKDFMTGSAVSFTNLSVVSFAPAAVALTSSATSTSGLNPPRANTLSSYTVTLTASNPGGGDLTNASVAIPVPSGVTVTSPNTATGTISGSPLVWNIGTLLPGATATATFVASLTPATGDAGTALTLVSAQNASGTDNSMAVSRTSTAPAIILGVTAPAIWSVVFNSNGGSAVTSTTVTNNEALVEPVSPTQAGFTFNGWFTEPSGGVAWNFATPVTGAIVLYAQWAAVIVPPTTWSVVFNSNGGSAVASTTVTNNEALVEPTSPTRTGFTFNGWFTEPSGGASWNFATPITGATTLYAQWAAVIVPPTVWSVVFNSNGGTAVPSTTVTNNTTLVEPTPPTQDGFTFNGWFTEPSGGTLWNFATPITEATGLYAQWTAVIVPPTTWSVVFNSNGGTTVASTTVTNNEALVEPTSPTRTGFTFNGWFTEPSGGTLWNFATPITEATGLYAQWNVVIVPPTVWSVAFNSNGGTAVASTTVTNNEVLVEPTSPTQTGFTFNGWFTEPSGGAAWSFATPITEATVLYAQWTAVTVPPVDPPVATWSVVFNSNGGTAVAGVLVVNNEVLVEPTPPTQAGFTFNGWFTEPSGGVAWNFATPITEATGLYAQWTAVIVPPVIWSVVFNSNGGTAVDSTTVTNNTTLVEPTSPTRTGFTFNGWFTEPSGGALWNFNSPITEATTLYAQWTVTSMPPVDPPVVNWSVVFNSNGGTAVAGVSVVNNEALVEPTSPTRTGFTFNGWFAEPSGGTAWNFATPITEATVLYAQWTAVIVPPVIWSIVFNLNGETFTQTVSNNGVLVEPVPPTRTGFTFNGWFTELSGGVLWNFATPITKATVLYAQWTAVTVVPPVVVQEPTTETKGLPATGGVATMPSLWLALGLMSFGLMLYILPFCGRRLRPLWSSVRNNTIKYTKTH